MVTTPLSKKADVLRSLGAYDNVAFRAALRPGDEGSWALHTLVIDAIPQAYALDEAVFRERYNLERFVHTYPTAVFIAGVEESSEIISWFDSSQEFSIAAPSGPGPSGRVFTTRMPDLQDPPLAQPYFYRSVHNDGFDRMRWPHMVYTFARIPYVSEQYDNTRLVATGGTGSHSFPNFKMALMTLIYGEMDWDQAQRYSVDPKVAVRVVKQRPFFADIKQVDKRHVAVAVHGRNMLDTVVQLAASGGVFVEREIPHPNTYGLEVDKDLPDKGELTLIQGGEVLDEYEWDARYAPLPGAPESAPTSGTTFPLLGGVEYPSEIGRFATYE